MLKTFFYLLAISGILIPTACSLPTHTRSVSPYFDGSLKFNGQPIKNAKIMLSISADDPLCFKAVETTNTNDEGRFSLKPATETHKYKPFLNYEFDEWVICAKYNGQRYTLHTNNRYGSNTNSDSLPEDCGLDCSNTGEQKHNFYYESKGSSDSVTGSTRLECDLALSPSCKAAH